jgi:TRAP-type C4-dicarboxylate transport system permease small subunit
VLFRLVKREAAPRKWSEKRMKLEKIINSGIPILCGVLLSLIVALTFSQVILRQIFNFSLPWCDESSQFCMMWMVLLGSIYLTKHGQHINTGLKVHQKLNKRLIGIIDGILALATVGCAAVVTYQSAIFAFSGFKAVSLPWFNMVFVYIAVPLFMLTLCYYYLRIFLKNLGLIFDKD